MLLGDECADLRFHPDGLGGVGEAEPGGDDTVIVASLAGLFGILTINATTTTGGQFMLWRN